MVTNEKVLIGRAKRRGQDGKLGHPPPKRSKYTLYTKSKKKKQHIEKEKYISQYTKLNILS